MKKKAKRRPYGPQVYQLEPGFTQREAFRAAAQKARRDWRGMSYDPKTGLVKLV